LALAVAQAPSSQNEPRAQSPSAEQVELHTPPEQATRHTAGLVQVSPLALPQRPSLPHTSEAHWVARAQVASLGLFATHAPPEQKVPAPHSWSAVQVVAQWPAAQMPERHSSPPEHAAEVAAPHRPSAAHTSPRHSESAAQAVPPGSPQCPSAGEQFPFRQVALEVQAPVRAPHFPSASHTSERQAESLAQPAPLSRPQRPSGPQAPPRHCASAVQVASVGSPQRSSDASHTPLAQTARPTSAVHAPSLCRASRGIAWPTASLAAHVRVAVTQ
jgi:hypothetical protein